MHISSDTGELSPSSFIPFCEFGGNTLAMGRMIRQFDFPVCNSFKAKILNDQLCYEVDPNEHKSMLNFEGGMKIGLEFLLDYNEDRQVIFEKTPQIQENNIHGKFIQSKYDDKITINLNTIGMLYFY